MSQRKQKKQNEQPDDGMSTAGKVVFGIAAAAAGAAIGYLGGRLLDSWLSSTTSTADEDRGAASGSTMTAAAKVIESDSDDDDHQGVNKAAGNPPIYAQQVHPLTLHELLLEYYHKYVDIPRAILEDAEMAVDKVKSIVNYHLRQEKFLNMPFLKIGELAVFGSTTEGLKVIRPDQFDVMIPLKFEAACVRESEVCRGNVYIQLGNKDSAAQTGDFSVVCDNEQKVVLLKLLTSLKAAMLKAVEACHPIPYDIELSVRAAALTLTLKRVNDHQLIAIDFIPAIIVDNQLFIPASQPSFSSGVQPDTTDALWQVSYSRQERWAVDRFDSSVCGHLSTLKILKAVRLNHPQQFGLLSSYHCKILLFHVLEDLPDSCDWGTDAVGERLIDILTRLKDALSEHSLPHYFEPHVNLLEFIPQELCITLAKFIEKKLAYNDIGSLLSVRDY